MRSNEMMWQLLQLSSFDIIMINYEVQSSGWWLFLVNGVI